MIRRHEVVGKSDRGAVIGGLFYLHDTVGVPLSISAMIVEERGGVPDLHGFVKDALSAGWAPRKVMATVEEAVIDHGPAHVSEVMKRTRTVIGNVDSTG